MSVTNVKFRMQNCWEVLLSTGVSNKLPSKCPLDVMKITKKIEMQQMPNVSINRPHTNI